MVAPFVHLFCDCKHSILSDAHSHLASFRTCLLFLGGWVVGVVWNSNSPDGQKKAFVRLTSDYDALDVANQIGII